MIIRRIESNELRRYYEMRALTYHSTYHAPESAEQIAARAKTAPASREEMAWQAHYAAFDDDNTTMLGGLAVIPYPVRFDGHECLLAGVGGVATLPPYRRQGCIRGCMELALPDMYRAGAVFSYLFPFSTAFYRKFGYERCTFVMRYRLLIDLLPDRDFGGRCALILPGADFTDAVRTVYAQATARTNFSVIPGEYELEWTKRYDPLQTRETAYVYFAADGTPKAYMLLRRERAQDGFLDILCSRIMFSDAEGFYGLASLVRSHRADCRRWAFLLPASTALIPLLPETGLGAVACEARPSGMVRAVNVMASLRLARYIGEGTVALGISDAQIPENNGVFRVRYRGGAAEEVCRADGTPDAAMDISVFSRLIAGSCTVEALPPGDVTLHAPLEALRGVFYEKPCFMTEDF